MHLLFMTAMGHRQLDVAERETGSVPSKAIAAHENWDAKVPRGDVGYDRLANAQSELPAMFLEGRYVECDAGLTMQV